MEKQQSQNKSDPQKDGKLICQTPSFERAPLSKALSTTYSGTLDVAHSGPYRS